MKKTSKILALIFSLFFMQVYAKELNFENKNSIGLVDTSKIIEVGMKIPNIVLSNITNTSLKQIRLGDYNGKLLLLDFWGTWCSPCVASIPKNNNLQLKYRDKMQIVMVSGQKKDILDSFYQNYKKVNKLDIIIPTVYSDRILKSYFPHYTVPHCVWINQEGKVIAISDDYEVTEENIRKVINSSPISINQKTERTLRTDVDPNEPFYMQAIAKPLFIHDGKYGKEKIEYKSMLFGQIDGLRSMVSFYTGRLTESQASILSLYLSAYSYQSGKLISFYRNRVSIETKDSSIIVEPKDRSKYKEWAKKNSYCYDLTFPDHYEGPGVVEGPDSIRKYACEILKKELHDYFGYHSSFQKRRVMCVILKAIDTSKIYSKEDFGKSMSETGRLGAVFNEPNLEKVIEGFKFTFQNRGPFIDETNYHGKINIKIEAPLGRLPLVKEELNKFGLDLVEEYRDIEMLVISD